MNLTRALSYSKGFAPANHLGLDHNEPASDSAAALCRKTKMAEPCRFLPQLVKLTSKACAPIEEAKPSVSPARYMTTPFPFVSFACIFPSIRVSPRLTPRYLPEKSERLCRL